MTYRQISPNEWTIDYTPEEQASIDAWRRNLRLRLAREAVIAATERYSSLRALEQEQGRAEVPN